MSYPMAEFYIIDSETGATTERITVSRDNAIPETFTVVSDRWPEGTREFKAANKALGRALGLAGYSDSVVPVIDHTS